MHRHPANRAKPNGARPQPRTLAPAPKRERILAAALRLFANESYQAVTMDRVAQTASVAKGTLYLYFPSKDALYLGVLSDSLEAAHATLQRGADPRLPIVERLRRAIALLVEFFDQRRDLLRLYATEQPRLADQRNRIIARSRERGWNFFSELIAEGIRAGVIAPVDPRLATMAIVGAIRHLLLYYGSTRPVSELSAELSALILSALTVQSSAGARPGQPPPRRQQHSHPQ